MEKNSYLSNAELASIDALYLQYKSNPDNVDLTWRKFFEGFEFSKEDFSTEQITSSNNSTKVVALPKEFAVINLINAYRNRGHLFTKTNPVRDRRQYSPTLEIENYGLSTTDLETVFHAGNEIGIGNAKLKDIIAHLQQTYCESVGAEYKYIRVPEIVDWLEKKMESSKNSRSFSIDEKRQMLQKLNEAVAFENFLHTKFVGQKRFSLEGGETLIPALDAVIDIGADLGIKEFVIGMAHRGRLNVLANIFNKSYEDIFNEFEGKEFEIESFDGDVKYHLGFSGDVITTQNKKVHLSLTPNPSHLEAVDPIVEGIVRAKIDQQNGSENDIAPILIHGDAAIAGQGIVYEVIQMSLLEGYRTGGTIHLVVNNQIGFTTNYTEARSSTYCTDIAKVTLSPVFHVNGDDVEALVYTIQLAMEFRQKFHRDVFIDILGYRKYGHNEGDEPRFTQPLLYKAIGTHPNPREIYNEKLLSQGVVEQTLAKEMEKKFRDSLQKSLDLSKATAKTKVKSYMEGTWKGLRFATEKDFESSPPSSVEKKTLLAIADIITTLPSDKKFFSKITKLFSDRKEMLKGEGKLDWAMGELLAYGTLLNEGHHVRLSGQDVERGTFSHRHAVVKVEDSEEKFIPLTQINPKSKFFVFNSHLSEYGVLGFEYGYAYNAPNALVIWEAQFGDFNNGAQIIIDQYLSSSEDKWKRMNGVVMLLPHGYEGQGAEHSSARMERFLMLCAENNMQIVNCTTPANFFHVMRRQLKREFRKPLIMFTPKSLLRHPKCVSKLEDFTSTTFKEIIDDDFVKTENVKQVVFCSGKFYYDLLAHREKENRNDVALIRMEQLYPFPQKQFDSILSKYKKAKSFVWAQEEPENMGALLYMMRICRDKNLQFISRPESASPATGSHHAHEKEQGELVRKCFNGK